MISDLFKQLKTATILFLILTLLTGLLYPGLVTAISQLFFNTKANGSLIVLNNQVLGSTWIGQAFTDDTYFWGRPSATTPYAYNAEQSAGSNFALTNPNYLALVKERLNHLQAASLDKTLSVPVDLVTASASGLDPEISPAAAYYQVKRIAKARKIPEGALTQLVDQSIQSRFLGLLGEPRVNVLKLNLILDALKIEGTQSARSAS